MTKTWMLFCWLLLPIAALAEDTVQPAAAERPSPELSRKFGYALGRDLAASLQRLRDVMDFDALKQGLDDAAAEKPAAYSEVELQEAKTRMGQLLQARLQTQRDVRAAANLKIAQAFLEKNRKRKTVITTASGLQYEVLRAAKGEHPKAGSNVTVQYRGTLVDGTEFDSSYARNAPVSFPLHSVIAGWTEGVQLMAPGAKYKLFVPPALGYDERGAGDRIGPNELLIFEVELLSFDDTPPG